MRGRGDPQAPALDGKEPIDRGLPAGDAGDDIRDLALGCRAGTCERHRACVWHVEQAEAVKKVRSPQNANAGGNCDDGRRAYDGGHDVRGRYIFRQATVKGDARTARERRGRGEARAEQYTAERRGRPNDDQGYDVTPAVPRHRFPLVRSREPEATPGAHHRDYRGSLATFASPPPLSF